MNVPKLRFPGFREEWVEKRLGEVFRFISTNSLSRENLNYESGEIKNIHYGDIHKKFNSLFDINKEEVPFINTDQKLSNTTIDNYCIKGDIIFADASEDLTDVGKCIEIINTNDIKIFAGLHTIHARKIEEIFAIGFTNFLMKTSDVRSKIMVIAQGSKVSSISPKLLGSIKISFPTLPEQQKIAEFLSSVDNLIQLLTKKKTLLENYKKGIMQKIFSQEIRFKDDDGNDFPEWEEKTVTDIAESSIGLTYSPENIVKEKGVLVLRSSNIKNGCIDLNDCVYVSSPIPERCRVRSGDILLCSRNGSKALIGKNAYIKKEHEGHAFGAFMMVIRGQQNPFLFQFFQTMSFFTQIEKNFGATINQITSANLKAIYLPLPSLPEQQKIADFLSGIDRSIEIVSSQIEKAKGYKKGLLQQMFV